MAVTVRHFATNPDALDTYEDAELIIQRDGDIVRIDASVGDEADYPMGRPGVSLDMSAADARTLGRRLLRVGR